MYLAVHPTIERKAALKVLHREFSDNETVINRFISEAKAVKGIFEKKKPTVSRLSARGLRALSKLPHLTHLTLGHMGRDGQALLKAVLGLPHLTHLTFHDFPYGCKAKPYLKKARPNLKITTTDCD